ncbi:hypothetical protein LCGC14_1983310 [marine sediment metagenome]|uniref:Uncharacterized protein n=1 Tax=marine sediment metagenome TaxID=412755 RepID=A0A0F9F8F9_9ZZZZ
MPTLLESNPAGDLTLIESGCYGFTGTRANGYQFDDPSLTDWSNRFSDDSFSVSAGVLTVAKSLLLMWNKPSVSPDHTLPNNQIITTLRSQWNPDASADNRSDYVSNAVGVMHTSILPWQGGGFAMGSGGKVFFGDMWHTWAYESGVFQSYHTGMVASPAGTDHWSACRVKPDGTGGCDCSAGGLNLIQGAHGFQPDAPFTWCVCDSGNYALVGNPGLVSWQFSGGLGSGTEYLEWHAFYDTTIKVIGLPTGWRAKVIKDGDAVRAAATFTQTESGGEAILDVVGHGEDMPPWDEVQVLDASNVVMSTIQVRTFQPGTYGGDVYCYQCAFPCPPPGTESFFFFGQQTQQPITIKLLVGLNAELEEDTSRQISASLDAVVLGGPVQQDGVGLLYEDDFTSAVSADWEALAGSLYVWTSGKARGSPGDKMGLKESVVAARNGSEGNRNIESMPPSAPT